MSDAPRTTTETVRPILRCHPFIFVALFLVYFFALQFGYNHGRDGAVARFFIETLTVKPSVLDDQSPQRRGGTSWRVAEG